MSDELAARFVAVADEDLSAAYDMGVQDSMLRAEQYKRILTDLIAELRDMFGTDAEAYGEHIETFPIGLDADEVRDYLDRAERRLMEMEDE